jgi:biopolymer transport protein ExbB
MIKQLKTLVLAIGLVAGMGLASSSFASKPKEAAPAAAAPAASAPAAEAAPAAPAAPVAAAAPASAHEENPYGLGALWAQGDVVAKGTLLILVLMSMGSWYVLFTKYFEQSKAAKFAAAAKESFWSAASLRQGADGLAEDSPFRFIAEKGLESANKHTGLLGGVDFDTWTARSIQRAIGNVQNRMQDGLAVLATVGSTSPFIGLFGTVWGVMKAFNDIGRQGSANLATVAPGISEALIATAVGLVAAIPAVIAYNYFLSVIKTLESEMDSFASDFLNIVKRHFFK